MNEEYAWKLNRISHGPYHVEIVGPWNLPQVTGADGKVGLSGPNGAVFQATVEQANELAKLANEGKLSRV